MPSLNALGEFKFSFNNIANEKADLEAKNLPFENFQLPTTEAPPFTFVRHETPASDDFDLGGLDEGGDTGSGIDINSFLDDINNEAPPPPPPVDIPTDNAISALDDFLKEINPNAQSEAETGTDDVSSFLDNIQSEPAPDTSGTDAPAASLDGIQDETAADTPAADDFSSFLDGDQDEAAADAPADTPADAPADVSADGGGIPDDLLSGFSDDMEAAPADSALNDFNLDEPAAEEAPKQEEPENDDSESIDLGGESREVEQEKPAEASADAAFDDTDFNIDMPDSAPPPEAPQDFDSADIDFGTETPEPENKTEDASTDTSADVQDSDGIDLGGEALDVPAEPASDDFSSDSLPEINLPGENGFDFSTSSDSSDDAALPADFDIPSSSDTDLSGANDEATSDDTLPDTGAVHEFGDLGSDFATDSIELDTGKGAEIEGDSADSGFSGEAFSGDDDFSLTGLDDILNKSKVSAPKPVVEKKTGFFGRKKHKEKAEEEIKPAENIDEISLSQDDVDSLLHTLTTYPLNLRITCEELIAEQVILPEQLSKLIHLLVNGASVREAADHVELITGKPVVIPKSFEKSSGAAFEAEQASFAYIFVHNLLPVIKLFTFIAVIAASAMYLSYQFIYIPLKAESIYKRGYERIPVGEYQRANELFHEAFTLHRNKKWFYAYAEAFRDQRRYMLAESKYDELLRYYPRDKKGILDYAALNTYYLMNYEKANRLLQRELLDYAPNDFDGLLAAGDNFLDWADSNPAKFYDKYEDARFCYARLIEQYGWLPQVVERMMKYFIRTDNLKETLQLRAWFENDPKKRKLSPASLAELGGYLLDKQLIRKPGVQDPYIESIESVRDMLLQAVMEDQYLPEPHYHLARYYHNLGNTHEERLTLENAIRAFDLAKQESVKRRLYRVDTHYRYANLLVNNKEFFPADEQAVRGIELFEDFYNRNLIPATPQLGELYSLRGDLEYFVKSGNMEAALANYRKAETYGYNPPEVQYRMGAAYYQQEDWRNALDYLFRASKELPLNRRLLFAMGNAAYQRGDYFAAKGYYDRLLDILESQRVRLPVLLPNDNVQFLETGERLMMARNNAGVVNEALARQTGNRDYRSKAMVLYAESSRAWDAITRNPETMTRSRMTESSGAPSINLGYLNANNALRPTSGYRPQIFVRIDKDGLEPSRWEELAPLGGL